MASFRFIYEPSEFGRIIPAVLIDARATIPAIKNQIGDVIKAYTDVEVAKASGNGVLFFRIETIYSGIGTANGVLAGYFSLAVKPFGNSAGLYQIQLRPSFYQNTTQLNAEINVFLSSNGWVQYYLG